MPPNDRMGVVGPLTQEPPAPEPAKRRSCSGPTDSGDDEEKEDCFTDAGSTEGFGEVCTTASVGWSCAPQGRLYAA